MLPKKDFYTNAKDNKMSVLQYFIALFYIPFRVENHTTQVLLHYLNIRNESTKSPGEMHFSFFKEKQKIQEDCFWIVYEAIHSF